MDPLRRRAHVISGGFPRGALQGHDMDYARLRLLELLEQNDVLATVGNDFNGVEDWLPETNLLITYVAGPFLNDEQNRGVRQWINEGGKWLGLHGSSGGKSARVPGKGRRMVKASHHETLGGFFLAHPPIRKFTVDVVDHKHPLMKDLPDSFETIDEPYMIEVQQPDEAGMLLTAELGPDNSPEGWPRNYDADTALFPDGKTRALGFTRNVGQGGVTYIALGHAHAPHCNAQPLVDESVASDRVSPPTLRTTWETKEYRQILKNAIDWGMRA
jgi:type 1 glutamine amidotransferase